MYKLLRRAICALLCLFFPLILLPAQALDDPVHVVINGETMLCPLYLQNGAILAPVRTFADRTGGCVLWDRKSKTAYLSGRGGYRSFSEDRSGRILDDVLYAPIRELAKTQDMTVYWNGETRTAYLHSRAYEDTDDLYWLARIICAEACAEPMAGKIAVGNVVLNRVASEEFPDTIYEVIFDRKYGVQFEPVLRGTVFCEPDESCLEAARRALAGKNTVGDSLYFFNPELAESTWISDNRAFYTSIGGHDFYL